MDVKKYTETNCDTFVINDISKIDSDCIIGYIRGNYKKSCKIIRDESVCTLIFEHVEQDTEYVNDFFDEVISLVSPDIDIEPIVVKGLKPAKVELSNKIGIRDLLDLPRYLDIKIPDGVYKNETAMSVLNRLGYKAIVPLMRDNNFPKEVQNSIILAIKQYVSTMRNDKVYVSSIPDEEVKNFIVYFKDFMNDDIATILAKSTYPNLDDFINNASDRMLRSAYIKIVKELKAKFGL